MKDGQGGFHVGIPCVTAPDLGPYTLFSCLGMGPCRHLVYSRSRDSGPNWRAHGMDVRRSRKPSRTCGSWPKLQFPI